MNIYLLRHGPAEEPFVEPPDRGEAADLERELTEDGRAKTRQACRGLKRLGLAPDVILTSSAKRALQTAEIAAEVLDFHRPLSVLDALRPGARPGDLLRAIEGSANDVLLVGHEPDLSRFAAVLLGVENPRPLGLSKAGALALGVKAAPHPGGARLLWCLRRKHLAQLGD